MPREKVPDHKRQRTAQACDTCKRRKQKCDGLKPCGTCIKKNLTCGYAACPSVEPDDRHFNPAPKRSRPEDLFDSTTQMGPMTAFVKRENTLGTEDSVDDTDHDYHLDPISGHGEEEADFYGQARLLEDPSGKLFYIGDAASLSFLALIRMLVERDDGPSPFTQDPSRHRIMEAQIHVPNGIVPLHVLPDRETMRFLVAAYFSNTYLMVDVLEQDDFDGIVERAYSRPLALAGADLCLLFLVLANGLVIATPNTSSREFAVIESLRSEPVDRAELFFLGAKTLFNQVGGIEQIAVWAVQAELLMASYLLMTSRRNGGYFWHGIAYRAAIAMGFHRVREMETVFTAGECRLRCNLWRSLFVLDLFLATSLGRPPAIAADDTPLNSLLPPGGRINDTQLRRDAGLSQEGLNAGVQACRIIGGVLHRIYSKRVINLTLAQIFANECRGWAESLNPNLHAKRLYGGGISPLQGMIILHTQLLGCHTIVLLTRPFLANLMKQSIEERIGINQKSHRPHPKMATFAKASVAASTQTVALAHVAFTNGFLPRKDPFVLYFLFSAALVILSNEYSNLCDNVHYSASIAMIMDITSYCAKTDPQADRLVYILSKFREVVYGRARQGWDRRQALSTHFAMMSVDPWAALPVDRPLQKARYQTPAHRAVAQASQAWRSTPRTAPVTSGPSADAASCLLASPASSYMTLSPSVGEEVQGDDSEGEHEFHFDELWSVGLTGDSTVMPYHFEKELEKMQCINYANYDTTSLMMGAGTGVPMFTGNNFDA